MPQSVRSEVDKSSSGVISARMRPRSMRMIRSTSRCSTSSSRCSMMITAAPVSFCIRSISSMACFPVAGSRLASGSSKSRMSTSSTSTPARDTRCFCPPESSPGAWCRWVSTSTSFATAATRSWSSGSPTQSFSRAKAMSSATVRPTNCPSESWSTVPTILEISNMLRSLVSRPPRSTEPVISPR